MKRITYPFVPKSNRSLIPGQFWAIPLSDGRFAAGRVLAVSTENRTGFLAALMDWVGAAPPTAEALAGHQTVDNGDASYKTILDTGGAILGHRPLELDGIEPDLRLTQGGWQGCWVQKGYEWRRPATEDEWLTLPVHTTWGRLVIQGRAERVFVQGQPLVMVDREREILRSRLRPNH